MLHSKTPKNSSGITATPKSVKSSLKFSFYFYEIPKCIFSLVKCRSVIKRGILYIKKNLAYIVSFSKAMILSFFMVFSAYFSTICPVLLSNVFKLLLFMNDKSKIVIRLFIRLGPPTLPIMAVMNSLFIL